MEIVQRIRWIVYVLVFCVRISDSRLVCEGIYRVTQNVKSVISCQYESSFHAVRWYFNGNEESFLRIDRINKYGSGYDSGEFDIKSDGSMIINNPEIRNEGTYTISVLHGDGRSSKADMEVNIIVQLETISVEDCRTSSSSQCVQDGKEGTQVLICVARDARPKVDLTWLSLGPTGMKETQPDETREDSDNNLYTTISTLTYDTKKSVLQLFTCVANGFAVNEHNNSSVLVTGDTQDFNVTYEDKFVEIGTSFMLTCPSKSHKLAQIEATFLNGTKQMITEASLYHLDGRCVKHDICRRTDSGQVEITVRKYDQEGSYVCTSTNGEVTSITGTKISVTISPRNKSVAIDGCENEEVCSIQSALSGRITCSTEGYRPPMPLTWVQLDKPSYTLVSNVESRTVLNNKTGTSTFHVTADYKFENCGDQAELACVANASIYQQSEFSSTVLLSAECSTNPPNAPNAPAIVIPLVIVIIGVFVILIVVIKYKRDDIRKLWPPHKQGEEDEEATMEYKKVSGKSEMVENTSGETSSLIEGHQKTEAVTKDVINGFKKILKTFHKDVKQLKVESNSFQKLLENFEKEHNVDMTTKLHHIVRKLQKKEALHVALYLAECSTTWVSKLKQYSEKVPDVLLQLFEEKAVNQQKCMLKCTVRKAGDSKVGGDDKYGDTIGIAELSKDILAKHMPSDNEFLENTLKSELTNKKIRETYFKVLLFCLNDGKVELEVYTNICMELIGDEEVEKVTYRDVLLQCSSEKWLQPETLLKCLQHDLQEDITENDEYVTELSKPKKSCEKLARAVVQFFANEEIKEDAVFPFIKYSDISKPSTDEIPYLHFLHSIRDMLVEKQNREEHVCNLFHRIFDEALKHEKDVDKDEMCTTHVYAALKKKFQQIVLLNFAKHTINIKEYLDIMKRCFKNARNQSPDFSTVLANCSLKTWMNAESLLQVLCGSFENKLLGNEPLFKIVVKAFTKGKVQAADLVATVRNVITNNSNTDGAATMFIDFVTEVYLNHELSEMQLVEITKDFVTDKTVPVQQVFKSITKSSNPKKVPVETVVSAIVHYCKTLGVSLDDVKSVIGYGDSNSEGFEESSCNISYLYFLHSIHQNNHETIQALFHGVMIEALKKEFVFNSETENKFHREKDQVKIFVRFLLFLRAKDTINADKHKALLLRRSLIDLSVYNDILMTDAFKTWLEQHKLIDILQQDYHEGLIVDGTVIGIAVQLYVQKKIDGIELTELTKQILKEDKEKFSNIYEELIISSEDSEEGMEITINAILQYYSDNLISHDDVLKKIDFTGQHTKEKRLVSKKFPFVWFLKTNLDRLEDKNLTKLYDIVVEKSLANGKKTEDAVTSEENRTDIFLRVLLVSVTSDRISVNDLTNIAKQLVNEQKIEEHNFFAVVSRNTNENWLSIDVLKNVLKESLEKTLITAKQFVELMTNVYLHKRIEDKDYVQTIVFLVDKKQRTLDQIFQQLRTTEEANKSAKGMTMDATLHFYISTKTVTLDDVANAMKRSYILKMTPFQELSEALLTQHMQNKIPIATVMEAVRYKADAMKNKISYPYMLQSILHRSILKQDVKGNLFELFRDILEKALTDKGQHGKEIRSQLKVEITSLVFMRALFFGLETSVIDTKECMAILTSSVDDVKITKTEYTTAINVYMKELWVTVDVSTEILHISLHEKLITDDVLSSELQFLLQKKKLKYNNYKKIIDDCLSEKILTENCFKQMAAVDIANDEANGESWLRDFASLSKKNLISDEARTELLNAVIKKCSISKTDVKSILDIHLGDVETRKQYMVNLKFPGVMKRAKQAFN
ncbi:hypothetical protein BSL78_08597 [Apostichopus japonicus]|uniref:Ig-like domain-containing protein n=1 Tax=Stichopus japonicus TaxID=307972 RepID=A0A2G8L2P7_STIJA|nr:hypothetical protein BSL78_08597 [Apostichopus japonicus]